MPRCHSAAPMQNEQYGLSQGGLLRSGRDYVFALCGPLQERRRRQSAATGEASMGDGRDKIRWPLSMPSHDQRAAIPRRGALARMASGSNGTMCARALPRLRHVWAELPQCGVVCGARGQRLACGLGLPTRAPTRGCGACSRLPTPYQPAPAKMGVDPRPHALCILPA